MTRILFSISLLFVLLQQIAALYEDQVGKFDWKLSYIGKPKFAKFHQKHLIALTEHNVLASLSQKSGDILWRQVLEENHQQYLLKVDREILTVTGSLNQFYTRAWDPQTGSILWEWTINRDISHPSLWGLQEDKLIHVEIIPGSHFEVTVYNPRTGAIIILTREQKADWVGNTEDCALALPYLACTHQGQFYHTDLYSGDSGVPTSLTALLNVNTNVRLVELDSPTPSLLATYQTGARIVTLQSGGAQAPPPILQPNAVYFYDRIWQLDIDSSSSSPIVKVTRFTADFQLESSTALEYPGGVGASYIVAGACRESSCSLLLASTDHALLMARDGKILWTREEALSDVTAVEFFELPVSELDASIENEFGSDDVLSMFVRRLSTQARQIYAYFDAGQKTVGRGLVRDDFGLHQIIVLATAVGKLVAMDTLSGGIVWTYRLPNVVPFQDGSMRLLVQRSARHASLPALCLLLARDSSGRGVLFRFDPITGASQRGIERLPYTVKQALLLTNEDRDHIKPVLVIDTQDQVHVYPEDARDIVSKHTNNYVYMVKESQVVGYKVESDVSIRQVWTVNLSPGRVVAVSNRPANERVHSQGRVLPDRSVYYKYVNPNLVAVATITADPAHKHVLSVYVIDGVTGFVVLSTSHKRARGPVHLIHSENWLVYTYFNERFRRFEVGAAEMYEGPIQSNSSAFSSYAVSQLPPVLSQGYILPTNPRALAVTLTERGITNKFLLVATTAGSVTELPWLLLQPRFADHQCTPDESCIPYMPEVPIPAEATINYNRTLANVKGVQVAPAKLESTCHVLVYGLDLFYTRVAPSKTFDLLKEDFEYGFIVLVLAGLVGASYVCKALADRKTLRMAWK